jgi:hypothetical protein
MADAAQSDAAPNRSPKRDALTGDAAWQAARRAVADRNAEARRLGKKQRQEHEGRIAQLRRAASDPDGPPAPTA